MPKATLILEDKEDGLQYELTFEPELTDEQISGQSEVSQAVVIAVNLMTGLERWFELKGLHAVEDEEEAQITHAYESEDEPSLHGEPPEVH